MTRVVEVNLEKQWLGGDEVFLAIRREKLLVRCRVSDQVFKEPDAGKTREVSSFVFLKQVIKAEIAQITAEPVKKTTEQNKAK